MMVSYPQITNRGAEERIVIASNIRYQATNFAQITRFTNTIYAGIYALVGSYLVGGTASIGQLISWQAALVVGLIVAYGFVINDYVDVTVDSYSKPQRPIPSGRISRRTALWFAGGLAIFAFLIALLLGPSFALVALSTIFIATFYSLQLKSTVLWGNACMALLIALIPIYGGMAAGGPTTLIWIVAGLMWLFDFSHEILKTTADWWGDGKAGLRTVATVLGVRGAVRIFQIVAALFIGVALLPWMLGLSNNLYLFAILPCAVLPNLVVILLLARRHDDAMITLTLKIMRMMWISNLVPILLLG